MRNQIKISEFEVGQRVKVIAPMNYSQSINQLPAHNLKYNGKIGYIVNLKDMSGNNGELGENQSCRYEVFMTKIGVTLELPEECLELSEYRGFVL